MAGKQQFDFSDLISTLSFDPKTEQIFHDPEAAALVRREYRQGHWAVPKGL